jgi:hypothetical protein
MRSLDLHTEPYGSTGNIGENFLKLLGAPNTDALQTVIREAVQNIADAAKLGVGPEVFIRVRQLTDEQRDVMRDRLFDSLPAEAQSRDGLEQFLGKTNPTVLEICDFRTTGLGGPTRADRIPVGTTRTDFINFLRNIGTPRDTDHGGGTYGFGKAALYSVSRCRTILVDTYVESDDVPERRLIGCHIGAKFEQAEDGMLRQYTGRHWWGVAQEDGVVDPATNELATDLADAIGLPARGAGRTGTSIMMLDFDLAGESLVTVGNRIVEGLLWSFWPRMMRDAPSHKKFSCKVIVGEEELIVPDPEDFPPLDHFCVAMREARSGAGGDVRPISCSRPIKHLGNLAIRTGLHASRKRLVADSLFPPSSHHIALMRPVELVVRYMPGAPFADDRFEWAGVFLVDTDDEVERAFAEAEPPAHDDWVPAKMEKGHAKTFVNVALLRLQAAALEVGATGSGRGGAGTDGPPLAKVAGLLGSALVGVTGDGAGVRRNGKAPGAGRILRPTASRPVFVGLEIRDERVVARFATEVRQDSDRNGTALRVSAAIAVEGAASKVDEHVAQPEILSIIAIETGVAHEYDTLDLHGAEGRFEVLVTVPKDSAVTLDAEVMTGEVA